jgi:hypothetical protein
MRPVRPRKTVQKAKVFRDEAGARELIEWARKRDRELAGKR